MKYREPRVKSDKSNINNSTKPFDIFDFTILENGHITIPLVVGMFLLSQIALIFENREDQKLKDKLAKYEEQVFKSKKKFIKSMDEAMKRDIMEILRFDVECEKYNPKAICQSAKNSSNGECSIKAKYLQMLERK